MQRFLNILHTEFIGLHRAAYLLGIFAFFSQVLALVRDRLLAHFFGASAALDVYYAAFRIPDLIYISIASFVSITVLIPFLVKRIRFDQDDGGDDARLFLNSVFSVFVIFVLAVTGIVFLLIPKLSTLVIPGFTEAETSQFIIITRMLLLSPIILGISSMLGSITQVYRKFFVYASAPIFYNIGIIAGIVFLIPLWGIYGVAIGVIVGALLHLAIQFPVVYRHRLMPSITRHIRGEDIWAVIALSLPRTIALTAGHITLIVLIAMASFMIEGSISVFNFSFNLQSVPLSIIGVSYSVAAFPTLARLFSGGNMKEFIGNVESAVRHIIFWSIPVVVLFIVLRAQIVRTILGSGKFDWSDTRLTAAALAVFSISVLAQALIQLFVRGYYAAGRTRIPLVVNVFSSVFIVALSFLFVHIFQTNELFRYFFESLLRIEDVSGSSIIMLPLAYSVGMIANAAALWLLFGREFSELSSHLRRVFMEVFSASILMGFVAYRMLLFLGTVFDTETLMGIFMQGFFAGISGIAAGVILLYLFKNEEIAEVGVTFKRRMLAIRAIAPDKEGID